MAGDAAASSRKKFPKHLVEIYDIDSMLGQGAFSTVWRCVHRATGQARAVKRIDTTELSPREIAHEIALMRLLRHECVVRCYDVFLEAQYVNIVVDIFTGGDLVDGLNAHRKARGRIPDHQLAHLSAQMVAAVAHVHGIQIVHRDIKGENFLSDRPDIGDPNCRVALADFGTAMRIEPGDRVTGRAGTPAFWAPEVWAGSYEFGVDVWAIGTTAFILLSGSLPFDGESQICKPTAPGEPSVAVPYFASRGCTEFINACLIKDPGRRPSASEAAWHPWLATPRPPAAGGGGGGSSSAAALQQKVVDAAPSSEQVSKTASALVEVLIDGLGAVAMGCCSGLGLCLDILLGGGEAASPPRKPPAAAAPQLAGGGGKGEGGKGGAGPESVDLEKQITELTKRISTNHARLKQAPRLAPPPPSSPR